MVTLFEQKVYDLLKKVPTGKVTTYKALATALGKKGFACRAVGNALHKNPYAPTVPCHRVVATNGSLGGFAQGSSAKIALLASEGIIVLEGKILDFEKKLWLFT